MLDTQEYLHLAVHAAQRGDIHSAMSCLRQVLQNEPQNAVAMHLLAAQHAEIGLYDRAIEGMQQAVLLAPDLDIARFQLGLLYLQLNRRDDARQSFEVLHARATDVSLRIFATAYTAMLAGNTAQAITLLRDGVAGCTSNPALKADMERVLTGLEDPHTAVEEKQKSDGNAAGALMLHAYRNSLEQ